MFLRTALLAAGGDTRRRVTAVLHDLESLTTNVASLEALDEQLARRPFDLVVIDAAHLGAALTPERVQRIRESEDAPEVVILGLEHAPELRAAHLAAAAFAVLPISIPDASFRDSLRTLAERRLRQAHSEGRSVPDEDYCLGDYVTTSPAMRAFLKTARRIASRDATVLLLGETGVGKGLLARSLHNEGPRSTGPFIAVNCGALTESLLESELFGHERGAFTGAERARRGHFELAHGGTLFLDEVGELPLAVQTKLLTAIEDREVQPLGSEKRLRVDVRLITATHRDLAVEVQEGRFREDLYYRLNVITLRLPALRERVEDIPELAQSYVEHYRALLASDVKGISPEALDTLRRYAWPGNIRELANAIERAVIMSTGVDIGLYDLPLRIQEFAAPLKDPQARGPGERPVDADWLSKEWAEVRREVLEEAEYRYLDGVLRSNHGKVGATARQAGMDPRSLNEKMRKYALRKEDYR